MIDTERLGTFPPDGRSIAYDGESREAFASTRGLFVTPLIQRYDVAPDDQRLLAIRAKSPDAPSGEFVLTNVFEVLRAATN